MTEHYRIYTDGSCDPNPGPGGWAAIVIDSKGICRTIKGSNPHTTNARMELEAAVQGLASLPLPSRVTVITDSEYLKLGITEWVHRWIINDWKKTDGRSVKNLDLWHRLLEESNRHSIQWHWVRSHDGDPYNEKADAEAKAARNELVDCV